MSWLGKNPELKYTALGRIAFAVGAGAVQLEMVLTKLANSAKELELEHPNSIIRKWRREGEKAGNAYACQTTEYKITAVFLNAEASYTKWLTKMGAEAPPSLLALKQRRATPITRPRSAKLPLDYAKNSDISRVSGQRPKRGHPDDVVSGESLKKAPRSSVRASVSGERHKRRVPTPTTVEESKLTFIDNLDRQLAALTHPCLLV